MRIHYLQHVPFEGIGSMESYFISCGYQLDSTHLYLDEPFPELYDFDWLIVMGGPMGVGDELQYSWMSKEKSFIKSAIESGKIVLGVCLGAQLIAEALGAKVYNNGDREIGWFPIDTPKPENYTILQGVFPQGIEVFHWHGETFDIPTPGILLASSKACHNQAFIVENRVVGLQFHLETTLDSAKALVENCRNELDGSKFVQNEKEILAQEGRFLRMTQVMAAVLEKLQTNCA